MTNKPMTPTQIIEKMREALEAYANADYEGTGFWDGIALPGILSDKGAIARCVLADKYLAEQALNQHKESGE